MKPHTKEFLAALILVTIVALIWVVAIAVSVR